MKREIALSVREDKIISQIAKMKKISMQDAAKLYYQSEMSQKISEGRFEADTLDYERVVQGLFKAEPGLFA